MPNIQLSKTLIMAALETSGFMSLSLVTPVIETILMLVFAGFAFGIAFHRRSVRVHSLVGLYLLATAAAKAAPYGLMIASGMGTMVPSLVVAVEALPRAALVLVMAALTESSINRPWVKISLILAALVPPVMLGLVLLLPAGFLWVGLYMLWTLMWLHGISACIVAIRSGRTALAIRRFIPGLIIWVAVGSARVHMPILAGIWPELAPILPWLPPALSIAELILALTMLAAAFLELAKPAPEDTVLDDLVHTMSLSMKRFIPAEFLAHLHKLDVVDLRLGDHVKKEMTIFFSDIRGFTELSETLTPEESFAFINSYLSRVVPIVRMHGGFVDKYMGDGIMALFEEGKGADEAVASAVEMQYKMIEYNGHRANMNYRPISMGIGIHTGTLMLGVVGVIDRMEGTVISDAVNLSSRLQSIAKAFNIPLVISERTFMSLEDPGKYKYRFIGKVKVKGKAAPVSVFEIFDGLPADQFERKMRANTFFEQGMMAYYQKDFNDGLFYFQRALEYMPEDGASRFYLETCLRKVITVKASQDSMLSE
jgi:two-component system sensor histidine kinase ChiS